MNKTIGLIINPIAGMGGKVALKGTDGKDILARAIALAASPEAGQKTMRALAELARLKEKPLVLTVSGAMGEFICREAGLPCQVIYQCGSVTTAEDTIAAAMLMKEKQVDLLLFSGGDGTARNICTAVGQSVPALGIPAGVKMQSAVFALSPIHAGRLVAAVLGGEQYELHMQEVVDLDEDAYRMGAVSSSLYGYLCVPCIAGYVQNMKQTGFASDKELIPEIAYCVIEQMECGCAYAIGSGTTAKSIMHELQLPYELLGVDVIRDGCLLAKDVSEQKLWEFSSSGRMRIIVSPIGGQGFIFGRGNHQFSARVLAATGKDRIQVIATAAKLASVSGGQLRIDCGDERVNAMLSGYYQVTAGYRYRIVMPCNKEQFTMEKC